MISILLGIVSSGALMIFTKRLTKVIRLICYQISYANTGILIDVEMTDAPATPTTTATPATTIPASPTISTALTPCPR